MRHTISSFKVSAIIVMMLCQVALSSCDDDKVLFELMSSSTTGIRFQNKLTFQEDYNIYKYYNYYNGGGVAIGDVNNDGYVDIYLTANMDENRLYLNDQTTGFSFEDITDVGGVGGAGAWSTGVTMADVNGDGWLDIYVCNSGGIEGANKRNELFVNKGPNADGIVTFMERAEAYGLNDSGYSTHAAFFDYDKDGDLDLYLLNNSDRQISSFNLQENERHIRDVDGGDKLFRNDENQFIDVSEAAGIYGSVIGFGMGVSVGDLNNDGWQDIYVSNDFFERDYVYMNNGNGTFSESLVDQMKSISATSMGADIADVNNDGWMDVFVTEMLPEQEERLKTKTTFEDWDKYQYNLKYDYYHQFTRNTLQLNKGKTPDGDHNYFSEVGRLSGIEATDWSWGALIFDMQNDGLKDIFVSNGIYKDLTDQDFIRFLSSEETFVSMASSGKMDYKKLVELIPSSPIPNYAYENQGDLTFVNKADEYGLGNPSFSNGSAYGDLDNDGDLDLVVNNVNAEVTVYRNNSDAIFPENNYLKFDLKGTGSNSHALGTRITAVTSSNKHLLEQMPVRGFQSCMDHRPNLGIGTAPQVDTLIIEWPDGQVIELFGVEPNQTLHLEWVPKDEISDFLKDSNSNLSGLFQTLNDFTDSPFVHQENDFVDFDRNKLLNFKLSTEGPKICVGDVNSDGLDDFYIGGAKGQVGALFIQESEERFLRTNIEVFEKDKSSEDSDCLFIDVDNDKDLDLYVASGGFEFSNSSLALLDRVYINDGAGNFRKSGEALPDNRLISTSCVSSADFDLDGDIDLFIGTRVNPVSYGIPVSGYLLRNDSGVLRDVTRESAPGLLNYGLFTGATWADIDNDRDPDLITIGDWMPISIFENVEGMLVNATSKAGLDKTNGWWSSIESADLDSDGDIDFVMGNHGLNSRFEATLEEPIQLYANDFDNNGNVETIICTYSNGHSYPVALLHDLTSQLPHLKKKYLKYESYKGQTIHDIFSTEELKNAVVQEAYKMESFVLLNNGEGTFNVKPLPQEVQSSPIYAISIDDFDGDGKPDILMGGNLDGVKPEFGRYAASYGHFLKGIGNGDFVAVPSRTSGFFVEGQVRDIKPIQPSLVLIARNNDSVQWMKLSDK